MEHFREIALVHPLHVSIEYVISHDKNESYILHRDLPFQAESLKTIISVILDQESISINDVISIKVDWIKSFKNSVYDGESYKVVGED